MLCQAGLGNQESQGLPSHSPTSPNLPPTAGNPAWVSVAAAHPAIDKGLGLGAEGRRVREAGSPLARQLPVLTPDADCLSACLLASLSQNVYQSRVIATAPLGRLISSTSGETGSVRRPQAKPSHLLRRPCLTKAESREPEPPGELRAFMAPGSQGGALHGEEDKSMERRITEDRHCHHTHRLARACLLPSDT